MTHRWWLRAFATAAIAFVPARQTLSVPAVQTSQFAAGTAPGTLAIADLDGDGHADIAVANERSHDVTILLGDGKGGFVPATGSPFAAGPNPNDIAVDDFNRDGRPVVV
jgi:FG-GAP-like repeat